MACPFYNESGAIDLFMERLIPIMQSLGVEYEIVCVNDGSTDDTLLRLLDCAQRNRRAVRVIDLSRNFGKGSTFCCDRSF